MMSQLTRLLKDNKIMMTNGTIVDATIVQAPSSTKNEKGERDPYMKSVKNGNDCNFHMLFALANIYKLRSIGISPLRSAKTA